MLRVTVFFITAIILVISSCASAENRHKDSGEFKAAAEGRNTDELFRNPQRSKTLLKKPDGFNTGRPEMVVFNDDRFDCTIYARSFAQGNAVYAEFVSRATTRDVTQVSFVFDGRDVPLTATSWGYRGIAAIDPERKPGKVTAVFAYHSGGSGSFIRAGVTVKDVEYTVSRQKLDLGKFSDESYYKDPEKRKFILECDQIREQAFKSETEDSITNMLSYPRDFHKVTGAYWNKRIYLSYEKKKKNKMIKSKSRVRFHRGVDLKGDFGAPVYAMADGVVVLSHLMFFEGNMVVLDHGNRVFSYYMHMDRRTVSAGERVRAGQQIGAVGSTGTSTGPHLHFAVSIRGVHVDPLSFFWLPVNR